MHENTPPILFHYTTAAGLLGILGSNALWATHARFLNDSQEIEYGIGVIRQVLHDYATFPQNVEQQVLQKILDNFADYRSTYFVCCFCETDDLLSQWRGYTKGEVGYSIGFDTTGLFNSETLLRRVIYSPEKQIEITRSCISSNFTKPFDLELALLELAICFKHPSFAEEKEWRLIFHLDDWRPGTGPNYLNLRFRAGKSFVIPYIELKPATAIGLWHNQVLNLKSIRIGPTPNVTEAREALQWLLWNAGYNVGQKLQILMSTAPLRI